MTMFDLRNIFLFGKKALSASINVICGKNMERIQM